MQTQPATPARRPATAQPVHYPRLALPRLELMFADGSAVWAQQTKPDALVRLVADAQGSALVDLRRLVPELEADYLAAPEHDKPATIFFSVRLRFGSAAAFMAAARGAMH